MRKNEIPTHRLYLH